jgi:hypothetical protein
MNNDINQWSFDMQNPFPLVVIFLVAGITALIVYLRTPEIAGQVEIETEGLARTQRLFTLTFTAGAILFGVVVAVAYNFTANRWPALAQPLFMWGSLAATLLFSIAAAIIRPREGLGGVLEVIALNLLWGLGYGWVLPYTLSG